VYFKIPKAETEISSSGVVTKNEQTVGGLSAHKKGGWGVEKRPIKSNKADQISQKPATFGGKPLNHLKKNKKHFRARERRFFIR